MKNRMLKYLAIATLLGMSSQLLMAKEFNLDKEIKKCQGCHGVKFDKKVLNASKKISELSKKELLSSFDGYLKASSGGRKGLMKVILKKYTEDQRNQIASFIVKNK